ncbi:MAG: hypothetical protein LBT27_05680 [Prevotellaceae bacterium]|nr:hypothetical protein [Prevotellaceae bacterium]
MKTNLLKITATLLIFSLSITSCDKDKQEQEQEQEQEQGQYLGEYYVSGYDACSSVVIDGENGEAGGYYIVSEDLRDTLLTYNLPKNIFNFPSSCFSTTNFYTPRWFPNEFRNEFKMKISYEIASEEDMIFYVCLANVLIQHVNATQIIIKSANKID